MDATARRDGNNERAMKKRLEKRTIRGDDAKRRRGRARRRDASAMIDDEDGGEKNVGVELERARGARDDGAGRDDGEGRRAREGCEF